MFWKGFFACGFSTWDQISFCSLASSADHLFFTCTSSNLQWSFSPGGAVLCVAPLNDCKTLPYLPKLFKIHLWVNKRRQIKCLVTLCHFFRKTNFEKKKKAQNTGWKMKLLEIWKCMDVNCSDGCQNFIWIGPFSCCWTWWKEVSTDLCTSVGYLCNSKVYIQSSPRDFNYISAIISHTCLLWIHRCTRILSFMWMS